MHGPADQRQVLPVLVAQPAAARGGHRAATVGGHTAGCVWNFGNDQPRTVADFGKDAQYGTPNVARYGGTIISAPLPNPEFAGRCKI